MTQRTDIYVVRNVQAIAETEKALRIEFPYDGKMWIPSEAIKDTSAVRHTGDMGNLILDRKWARNQGWI